MAEVNPACLKDATGDTWDAMMNLNLKGIWLSIREAARLMKPGGGVIIQISDAFAGRMWNRSGIFGMTKSVFEGLTRSLVQAFAPQAHVVAVSPGQILPGDDLSDTEWDRLIHRVPFRKQVSVGAWTQAIGFCLENQALTGQV